MNCLFCAAKSAPQAKFCSECGSPFSLQICPMCAYVNEKTAATCLKCGHAFALEHEHAVAATVAQTAVLQAASLAGDAAVDTKTQEWKVLLQEIEQEVHRQLEAEQHLPAAQNNLGLARRIARLAAKRVVISIKPSEYAGKSGETRGIRSRLPGLVAMVVLVLFGGAAARYLLPSSSATAPVAKHNDASSSQTAAAPQPMSSLRDPDEVNRGGSNAAPGAAATNVSLGSPQLVPAYDDARNELSTTAGARNDAELIPISIASPADVVFEERKPDHAAQPTAKKAAPPHRAKGGEKVARIPSLTVEHRVLAEAPARYAEQPAIADNRPCSDAIQALALCSGPSNK
jgi:hypothetical protein